MTNTETPIDNCSNIGVFEGEYTQFHSFDYKKELAPYMFLFYNK